MPDSQVVAIASANETTVGILRSRFHELGSPRMGSWLGVGNDPRTPPPPASKPSSVPAA